MKKLLLSLLCIVVVSAAFAQSVEDKVWKRVEALHKAVFETKDSTVMDGLVADYITYGHSGGTLEDRPTMIHKAATSKNEYRNPKFDRVSMHVVKKTAYVRYNFHAGSVANGVETPLAIGIFQVWQKLHGDWRMVGRQAVKLSK
jgi:hypothetical protein